VLLVLLLLAALILWALRGGGSGPAGSSTDDSVGGGPAPSLTPGATDTESHIDERPGGQSGNGGTEDASEGGEATGGDAGSEGGGGDGGGDGGAEGAGGSGGSDGGAGGNGAGGSGAGGSGGVAGLPDCAPGEQLRVSLRSERNAYPPDVDPVLRLTVTNDSATACKTDFGHAALTVELSTGGDRVWTSAHCPAGPAAVPTAVPAGGSASHVIEWDRRYSSREDCDGPDQPSAPTGTYLAEAKLAGGFPLAPSTFRLDED
jgi:hypothetical protein